MPPRQLSAAMACRRGRRILQGSGSDRNSVGWFYFRDEPLVAREARVLLKDEARRMAVNKPATHPVETRKLSHLSARAIRDAFCVAECADILGVNAGAAAAPCAGALWRWGHLVVALGLVRDLMA